MKLIVGLGNLGIAYDKTRHNIGFMVIDALLKKYQSIDVSKKAFKGDLLKHKSSFFLKPLTFMNLSGQSVLSVKNFYKIDIEKIIVIHDDLDLPFGALRFKVGGGHGGHNGLKSIDELIGKDYIRVRIGIGRPENKKEITSYVLGNFTNDECKYLDTFMDKILLGIEAMDNLSLNDVSSQHSVRGAKT